MSTEELLTALEAYNLTPVERKTIAQTLRKARQLLDMIPEAPDQQIRKTMEEMDDLLAMCGLPAGAV